MDFWQTVLVLVRRWYIAVPTFVGSLLLAGVAYSSVPTQYASGSILALTTPVTGGTQATSTEGPSSLINPLMNFDPSLNLTGSLIIQELSSADTASALGLRPGGSVAYEVTNGSTSPELLETGPFIFVQGTGPTPESAEDITDRVARRAAALLSERQRELKAPASTYISVQAVVPVTAGQPLTGKAERAAAAALALALLASLFAVYGFESIMSSRRRPTGPRPPGSGLAHVGPTTPVRSTERETADSR